MTETENHCHVRVPSLLDLTIQLLSVIALILAIIAAIKYVTQCKNDGTN